MTLAACIDADITDAELLDMVRGGDTSAYGHLYTRHRALAAHLARALSRSNAEADDLVSEAFAKVLDVLRAGKGPRTAFRGYLLTTMRHVAYDRTARNRRAVLTDDIDTAVEADHERLAVNFDDRSTRQIDHELLARAFAQLPRKARYVLWQTAVERRIPKAVAQDLGMTANGVAALAYRAREALRRAYQIAHLDEPTNPACQRTVGRLPAWSRGRLPEGQVDEVRRHLGWCPACAIRAEVVLDAVPVARP